MLWTAGRRTQRLAGVDIADRFAANLVSLRTAAGLTQEELAERAAVHRT